MSVMIEKKYETVEKKDETVEKKDETVEKKDENIKIEEGEETSDDEAAKPKKVRVRIQRKPRFSPSIWNFYKIEENKIQASNANKIIMDLARILIPLNFAKNPRFTHDSAVPIPPLPTLSLCDEFSEIPSDLIGFAKNQLVRGQNRFISAIDQAINLIS